MEEPEFLLSFPCFIIESASGRDVVAVANRGVPCVAVFTDAQLAEGYDWQHHLHGNLRPFPDAEGLREYLEAIPASFTHVVIDPRGEQLGYRLSIGDLLDLI